MSQNADVLLDFFRTNTRYMNVAGVNKHTSAPNVQCQFVSRSPLKKTMNKVESVVLTYSQTGKC